VYQRRDASGGEAPVEVRPDGLATDLPLVVLLDMGTASSAEIVSGAIAYNERGTLVGEQTFGTGTVLNTIELSDGSAVRVGIERWLTPDGELIFDRGIAPDEVVELPVDGELLEPSDLSELSPEAFASSSDNQLQRAVELLRETLDD
ncbi:MAG: S41 family peptidase, partial [Chloroflexota bacterium]|nr:S41 family peptidase [Chloroflexota bacterium]